MPPTVAKKETEISKKTTAENVTHLKTKFSKSNVSTRSNGGAGESPMTKKPPSKKTAKADEDKPTTKRVGGTVADKVPKKNAQRVKGSTSLNKTVEQKPQKEATEKKRNALDTADKLTTGKPENDKATETHKTPRQKTNKPARTKPLTKKDEKTWVNATLMEEKETRVMDKLSDVEEKSVVSEDSRDAASQEIQNAPFGSCSFFEKLQQGVKAYFSSRNSLTPNDRSKREGGPRTRGRVAKGVKEDAKKRNPGYLFKNKICSWESDSYIDQLRSYSSLGGKSSNLQMTKPKIFQKLKRKKLYRPKKHYVRIQIPRKGYFYRSTVQFKAPGSQGPLLRLEPHVAPRNEPKTQVSRVASSSSESSNLPVKKRINKLKKKPTQVERRSSEGMDLQTISDEKFNECATFNWPDYSLKRGKSVSFDVVSEFSNPGQGGETQMSAIFDKTENSSSERALCQKKITELNSSYTTLISYLNSALEREEIMYDLEITPVNDIKEDMYFRYANEPPKETVKAFREDSDALNISPIPSAANNKPNDLDSFPLIDEIDIHLELQNYLKAFDRLTQFKNKTKNTLESSHPSEEFYEASDTKSGTSFKSASSAVTHVDDDQSHSMVEDKQETEPEEESDKSLDLDFYEKIRPYVPKEDELEPPKTPSVSQTSSSTWSPTIQDLIDIYNSVLQQNKKIRRNTRKSVTNCLSSHLFNFLNNKLKEKKFKADLLKLSQSFTNNYRTAKTSKSTKQIEDPVSLQNYVAMFQELLQSLTFSQIARLNNAISGLHDYSEKNHSKELIPTPVVAKTVKQPEKSKPKTPVKSKKPSKVKTDNSVQKIELPSPTELELMLKSCFNSKGLMCTDPALTDSRNKILVTVKLSGDRVLVSNLSYFKNEEALKQRKPKRKGTSELIIESVSKKQVNDVWYRKTKSSILRELSSKSQKQKTQAKKPQPKRKPSQVKQYKYDRMQLRSQHPIEAIAEGSESELSDPDVKEEMSEKSMLPTNFLNSDLESLMCNLRDETERNLTSAKSPKRRPALPVKKKPLANNVRSMVDLKNKVSNQNFFCYPSIIPEKKIQDKQIKFPKSAIKLKDFKTKVLPTPENPMAKSEELTKSSSDTVLYLNNGLMTECCSIELLFADNSEIPSGFAGSNVTVSDSAEKGLSEKSYPVELLDGKSRGESPILLHAGNGIDVESSFFSNMIHSDSFLKCLSGLPITKSEMNLLLKSNSKIKFYPGRVKEKKEDGNGSGTSPFVTFVLTPSQNEKMGLCDSRVEIVEKSWSPVVTPVESDGGRETQEILDDKVPLEVIEEFIRQLSKAGRNATKLQDKSKNNKTKFSSNSSSKQFEKNKNHIVCFTSVDNSKKKKVSARFDKTKVKKMEKGVSKQTKRSTPNMGKRKKVKTSPLCLDKVVNNVMKVIENFKKEQNNKKIPEDTIITLKNPLDAQIEFKESLKVAIMAAKHIPNKTDIIAIIEKVFKNQQRKLSEVSDETCEKKKEVKSLKIKIHCCSKNQEGQKSMVNGGNEKEIGVQELGLLDSLLIDEPQVNGLQRKGSVYFDALENPEEFYPVVSSSSNENLPSQDSDEIILTEITNSLERNKFPSSKNLVEGYLKKTENSEKLKKLLTLVEDKSRSLMIEMERKAWLEVLALLEELVETVETRNSTNSLKTTKAFVDKIQLLNQERLADFENFCSGLSRPSEKVNFFGRITKVLKQLKTKLTEGKRSSSEYEIHSTMSLADLNEGRNDLKRKIQSQMSCIEELMQSEESIPREIREVKDKVGKKIKSLDKFLGGRGEFSLLDPETTCSETEGDSSMQEEEEEEDEDEEEEEEKVKDVTYLNLLQSFLRIWDTRMSLRSLAKDI